MARLAELLARQGAGARGPQDLRIDSLLTTSAATVALVEEIENAGPFGAAAPAPRFAFANVAVTRPPDRRKPPEADASATARAPRLTPSPSAPLTARLAPRWKTPATAAFTLRASWS